MIPKQCILVLFLALGCTPHPRVPSECKGERQVGPSCQKLEERLIEKWKNSRPRAKRKALLALAELGNPIILKDLERMAMDHGGASNLLIEAASVLAEPAQSKAIDNAIQGHLGAERVIEFLPRASPEEIARVLDSLLPRGKASTVSWFFLLSKKENADDYFVELSQTLEGLAKVHPRQDIRMRAAVVEVSGVG